MKNYIKYKNGGGEVFLRSIELLEETVFLIIVIGNCKVIFNFYFYFCI